jgi:imidazole glycerol phosphate synthase subunit HisF
MPCVDCHKVVCDYGKHGKNAERVGESVESLVRYHASRAVDERVDYKMENWD